jgi:hypothetical protein
MEFAEPSFERMMDEIAAAESIAELDYLRGEVYRVFAVHSPQRRELETTLDAMGRVLVHGRRPRSESLTTARTDSGCRVLHG